MARRSTRASTARSRRRARRLDVEVVVVDNASRDATVERVRARAKTDERIRLLELGANSGFAAAVNAAFAGARGDHVLILNPDCVMDPGCAAALRARLHAQPASASRRRCCATPTERRSSSRAATCA